MGKNSKDAEEIGDNCKKYGVPFYGASFVPSNAFRWTEKEPKHEEENVGGGDECSKKYVIYSGGGGEGRSGIPNALIISQFNHASNSLSDQPVSYFFFSIPFFFFIKDILWLWLGLYNLGAYSLLRSLDFFG